MVDKLFCGQMTIFCFVCFKIFDRFKPILNWIIILSMDMKYFSTWELYV